ncbi:hypothetical protein [Bacillus dakarensis]|uniref:hypothetical protein n=1 Tax=Robertmurraya dakarensis TaxID=1926278 RepID=UPI0009809FE5|nr:hypothetical protein [Bacillus dakarensis]
MKAPQKIKNDYMFATCISSSCEGDKFLVELSPLSSNLENSSEASQLIRNFDELIDFFEEHFEE